jgi:hypothetical protein
MQTNYKVKPMKAPLSLKEQETIKTLYAEGRTYHAISKEINRSPHTVKRYLLSSSEVIEEVEEKKNELAKMFEGLAKRMITSISDEDILKISAYQRTISAGISTDKMRLLKGQSTENLAIDTTLRNLHSSLFNPPDPAIKTIDINSKEKR